MSTWRIVRELARSKDPAKRHVGIGLQIFCVGVVLMVLLGATVVYGPLGKAFDPADLPHLQYATLAAAFLTLAIQLLGGWHVHLGLREQIRREDAD